MRRRTRRHTGSFTARREDGREVTIHIMTEFLEVDTLSGPAGECPGTARLYTEDGDAVNRIEKGRYQIVATGELLTSHDPAAS